MTAEVVELRPYLFSIAYRMLGSVAEAEDVVQEAYVRLSASAAEVERPKAYAATVVTRLAIDELRSARARRETYVGSWLPEPLLTGGSVVDPAERVEADETVSYAFLLLLERLSPLERAAFVLREAFSYSYAELAAVLERDEAAVRKLVSRARAHVETGRARYEADRARRDELASRFFAAWSTGDVAGLERLLTEDVRAVGDGGGAAPAAARPVAGRTQVARFLTALARQAPAIGVVTDVVEVNGAPALLSRDPAGRVLNVAVLEVAGGSVSAVYSVVNPGKLRHLGEVVAWAGSRPV